MPLSVHESTVARVRVAGLREQVRGRVLRPGDNGYDTARRVWNGMADRRPAVVVLCAGPSDVSHAVRFAAEHDLVVSVRSGGHSFPGHSTNDGGLVIDLSPMRGLRVDPATRLAWAEPGLLQADLDTECAHHGLAVPGGQVSHTGVAGLTLGGGIGWLSRLHGLACDNLLSADLVLADGTFTTVDKDRDPELYRAIRGGGGNFGVVTNFEFALHPQGDLLAGVVAYPASSVEAIADRVAELWATAPRELGLGFGVLGTDNGPAVALPFAHALTDAAGHELVGSLGSIRGRPVLERSAAMPYPQVQKLTDAGVVPGMRYYARSSMVPALSAELLETLVTAQAKSPSPRALIGGLMLGGAIADVAEDDTAFPHRSASFLVTLLGGWEDEEDDAPNIDWVRATHESIQQFTTGGVYVNELVDEGEHRVLAAYGQANHERLRAVKRRVDPGNLFRMNQNIIP